MNLQDVYSIDQETLMSLASQLQTIGSVVLQDVQTIITTLQGIDITGTPKEALESSVSEINAALSKLTMPDQLGNTLAQIAENAGMQEDKINKIFGGWSEGLAAIAANITQGIKAVIDAATSTPVGSENYTLTDYLSDTSKDFANSTASFVSNTNKLVYSVTGNNIKTGIENLFSNAVGSFQTLISGATSGNSSISSFLGGLFNR